MRDVLRLVAAVLLALLGVGGGAALASPIEATPTHAHNASYVAAVVSANQLERGPPATRAHNALPGSDYAVDHRSDGPSACAGMVAPIQDSTYTCTIRLVATGSASITDTAEATSATSWRVQATNAADDVASASNKIYSSRALQRMADEPGPFHNFPGSFDETIFSQGNRTVVPNYFNKAKPNLGNDSIQYRLPGYLNGRAGTYEIFTRPSLSGRTELIMHRFFRPDY